MTEIEFSPHILPVQVHDGHADAQDEPQAEPLPIRESYRGRDRLRGRVAIVTGGHSGIGRAVALHFVREGARVAVAYLDEDHEALETAHRIEREGGECLLFSGDLSDPADCARLVEEVRERFGRIDILVNGATERPSAGLPVELDSDAVTRTLQVRLFPVLHLCAAVIPHLPGDGVIINTAPVAGARQRGRALGRSVAEGAVQAFTRSLAQALAERGIRVNAVAPGTIGTPPSPAGGSDSTRTSRPDGDALMKRAGQPAEVAPAYVFLASEEASFITGQTLRVDGGLLRLGT